MSTDVVATERTEDIVLPGEGETRIRHEVRRRIYCAVETCARVAVHRHTFLLPNARTNAASRAYGRDDCLRSYDAEQFACALHSRALQTKGGYEHCATVHATAPSAHLFLRWAALPLPAES